MACQSIRTVRPENIVVDYTCNFRVASSYDDLAYRPEPGDPPTLTDSLLAHGLRVKLETYEDDGVLHLLRGFRRMFAISEIRKHRVDLFREIPVVVYRGLTELERRKLVLDHGFVKGLQPHEQLLAVKELRRLGMSQTSMGSLLGMSRSAIQDRCFLLDLPPVVEENYMARFEPGNRPYEDYVPFSHAQLDQLHIAALRGPAEFEKAWDSLKRPPVKGPSRADLEAQIETLQSRVKTLEECLRVRNLPVPPARYGKQYA